MSKGGRRDANGQGQLFQGLLPIDRSRIPSEILAGLTLAALAIPEVMGYTKIAGMPVITGMYTILIPMALYAVFGSSRHLVVGADSATAALLAAGLAGLATTASPEYVALAGLLALLAAAMLFVARLVRLGFLADFLSRTVLIGFLTGVGVQVAIGQIPGMLGIPGGGLGPLLGLLEDLVQVPQANRGTVLISLGVLAAILVLRRVNRSFPGALVAVVGAIALSYAVDLSAFGVALVGPVPGGLPRIGLPGVPLSWDLVQSLLPIAFSMFVVILAQSAATSRAYAARYRERFSEDVDLVGLGLANVGAGLTGAFVVNGSPTKTQMVDSAGGRSQLAQLTTVAIVILVLLFLTVPLSYMPEAVLAAVVFLIGVELVDLQGMRRIYRERRPEFWVALITALVVIIVGVEQGIFLAIVLSLILHTRHGYKPSNALLVEVDGELRRRPVSDGAQARPGLVLYRFAHGMYYANAQQMAEEIRSLRDAGPTPLRRLGIDMGAVDDVDFSAAEALRDAIEELRARDVRLVLATVSPHVRAELDASGITEEIGQEAYFASVEDIMDAYTEPETDGG